MKWYKITFKLNRKWCFSIFHYSSEEEKQEKIKRWKDEHNQPYNHLEVIWFDEDYDFKEYKYNQV